MREISMGKYFFDIHISDWSCAQTNSKSKIDFFTHIYITYFRCKRAFQGVKQEYATLKTKLDAYFQVSPFIYFSWMQCILINIDKDFNTIS